VQLQHLDGAGHTRGTIDHILANAIYAGLMRQGDDLYDGRHRAIITREVWNAVQEKTKARRQWHGAIKNQTSPLAGKPFAEGHHLTPTHMLKKGRRYHYYISHAKKLRSAPHDLTADRLRRLSDLPADWNEQRLLLGFV